jgi:HAD superfamily phosphatase (TIGR01668 family)
MFKHFIPDVCYNNIYEIDISEIKRAGVRGLICDIDNTLVPYEEPDPTEPVSAWIKKVCDAGIAISFVSNNGLKRVERFNRSLGFFAASASRKPSRRQLRAAMAAMGTTCSETAVLGDQIFTDILAGKRLGLHCILVKPINDKKTPFFIIKRLLEKPFIYIYNYRKQMRHK